MGERVTSASGGDSSTGHLSNGGGAGVLVVHERWGLVPHIIDVTERFGAAGFTALAPDLYHGASSTDADEAAELMAALDPRQAVRDLSGAVDVLVERSGAPRVGVVGYSMGGALGLLLATARPDAIRAVAPYYSPVPWRDVEPDWNRLDATVVGEYAELDEAFPPDRALALEADLQARGKDVTMHVHPGAHAAFFNDSRPELYAVEPALAAWERTLALFREALAPVR